MYVSTNVIHDSVFTTPPVNCLLVINYLLIDFLEYSSNTLAPSHIVLFCHNPHSLAMFGIIYNLFGFNHCAYLHLLLYISLHSSTHIIYKIYHHLITSTIDTFTKTFLSIYSQYFWHITLLPTISSSPSIISTSSSSSFSWHLPFD